MIKEVAERYKKEFWITTFTVFAILIFITLFYIAYSSSEEQVRIEASRLMRVYVHRFMEDEFSGIISREYYSVTGETITLNNRFSDRFYTYLNDLGYKIPLSRLRNTESANIGQNLLRRMIDY